MIYLTYVLFGPDLGHLFFFFFFYQILGATVWSETEKFERSDQTRPVQKP